MPLRRDRQPYRDYQLAKRFAWDAQTIDLIQDQADWQKLTPVEREFMKHLLALFVVFLNDHLIVEGCRPRPAIRPSSPPAGATAFCRVSRKAWATSSATKAAISPIRALIMR